MNQTHYNSLINMYRSAPINKLFNPKLEVKLGKSIITMNVNEKFHHSAHSLHGSIYFKMLDDSAFFAANSFVDDVFLVTSSFTTYLIRPITKGKIKSIGKVVSKSKNQFISESILFDAKEKEVARGSGIFVKSKYLLNDALGYNGK